MGDRPHMRPMYVLPASYIAPLMQMPVAPPALAALKSAQAAGLR